MQDGNVAEPGYPGTEYEEPRWHAALASLVALALYITLPPKLTFGPYWLLPLLIFGTMVPLLILKPKRHNESPLHRAVSIAHIAALNLFNVVSVVLLVIELANHAHSSVSGRTLLLSAGQIWLTNVIVYALWFWEIDGDGPDIRAHAAGSAIDGRTDFLFPQSALPADVRERLNWRPRFFDYLFLAFTNATAFSPTDAFPLTQTAKVLMMGEALTSLVTIAVVAGRAVNILS
ncbi:MAG: hypothetical protein ACYDG0_08755 [Vulcanimicrobiaceae bacterium]